MADENIKIGIIVDDGGTTKNNVKDANSLAKAYDSVAMSVKAVKAAMAPKTTGAIKGATQSPMESIEYGQARASVGTGAAGRDFSKQAQGLGGLVHLYATYAANLFAAGAAFRALSQAADTTNMVKGLDQLGAASGKSLGSLSKQLVDAADGAISLRDAMTAVAQSSAAGMSSSNILRLGDVAKKASQALGVSMPDAVSRLSRGITKLEPELLDELGIFTKINDSNELYARALGKTASSLTDFEKRQGFANAVLAEAESKFGKIKIEANPYDKLLASISNLGQKGLELVNVVLGPLVKLLSESPLALTAVIAGIAKMIISQAIPAIGQWREALKQAADESLIAVSGRSTAAKAAMTQRLNQARIDAEALAEVAVHARDEATNRLNALSDQKFSQSKKRVTAILDKPVLEVSSADLKYLDDHAEMNITRNAKLASSYREVADTIRQGQAAEQGFAKADEAAALAKKKLAEGVKSSQIDDIKYRELSQAALLKNITATAAANAKEVGYIESIKNAWTQLQQARKGSTLDVIVPGQFVKNEKGKNVVVNGQKIPVTEKVAVEGISKLQVAQGALGAVTGATVSKLSSFASKLGTIGIAIGIAAGAFEIFNLMFSNSTKQIEEFNKSTGMLSTSIDNVGKTLDALRNKNPDQILSIESVQARANAFNELNDTLAKSTKAFEELGKNQNWWERSIEGTQRFMSLFTGGFSEKLIGGGAKKQMADALGGSVIAAIKATESGPARERITKQLSELVGFDASNLDTKGLQKALNGIDFSDLQMKSEGASRIIKKFSNEANNTASTLTALQESLKQTDRDVDALTSSLTPSDPLGKIGMDLLANSSKINLALKDPVNGILALKAAVDDPKFLSLLPAETSTNLLAAKTQIDGIAAALGQAREQALKAREELQRLKDKKVDTSFQEASVKTADWRLADLEKRAKETASKYNQEFARATFQASFTYLEASLKNAMAEGAIIAAKGYVSVLAGAGANTSGLDKELRNREFAIQRQLIETQYAAKEAQERNTIAIEKNTLIKELELQTAKLSESPIGSKNFVDAQEKLAEITKSIIINENKSKILQNPSLLRKGKNAPIIPGEEDLMQTAAGQLSGYLGTLYGKQGALAKISGAQAASDAQAVAEGYKAAAVEANKLVDSTIKADQLELDNINYQQSIINIYDEQLAKKKSQLEIDILANNAGKEYNNIQANINILKDLEGKFAVKKGMKSKEIEFAQNEELARVKALTQAELDQNVLLDKLFADTDRIRSKSRFEELTGREAIAKVDRANLEAKAGYLKVIADATLSTQEGELSYKTAIGLVTTQEAVSQKAAIELLKQKNDYEQQLLSIKYKQAELDARGATIKLAEESGLIIPSKVKEQYDAENTLLAVQTDSISASNVEREKAIELNVKMASDSVKFSGVIKDAFMSMTDALVEFTKTGKLNFESLIQSMLANILKLYLNKQFESMFTMISGSGILNAASNALFGNPNATTGINTSGSDLSMFWAKGGAFDDGVSKFAQGGAFTNSIVSSPTLFKFAKGAGMMGEAGPEAIMPLKRDSNGNLGVRTGGGGQTSVVVNNYSTAQATTKETTDSRGNRKIEVIVGDMVAQEVSRPGSAMQQTMGSTFGQRPMVPRR